MRLYPQKRRGLYYGINDRDEGLYQTVDITCTRTRVEGKLLKFSLKQRPKKLSKKADINNAFMLKIMPTQK